MNELPQPTTDVPSTKDVEDLSATATPLTAHLASQPGQWRELSLPGYEILGELGRGGMGIVYKARHLKLNRLVAVKKILAGEQADQDLFKRFCREAEVVAQMQHPHIVQIHEVGEHNGQPFLSFEYLEGGSLAKRLAGTPLPEKPAAALVEALAGAMHAAHERGIVHRDLKPANILFAADGTAKIADFGLAKRLDSDSLHTQSGAIVGTPSYMAPEQASGRNSAIGPPADVYALGAILYELLTGRPPFKAASLLDTVWQVLHEDPVAPSRLQPRISRDLETIALKCLSKEPVRRHASAAALAEDLRRFRERRPILARPLGRVQRFSRWVRRNPVVAALLGTVFLILLAGALVASYFALVADQARQLSDIKAKEAQEETERTLKAKRRGNRHLYAAQMNLAQRDWEKGLGGPVRDYLANWMLPLDGEDLRGWEWHYQQRLCQGDLRTLTGHTEGVSKVFWSPDGQRLASAGGDGTVKLWDAAGGRELRTLRGHNAAVADVTWSPDGSRLASASEDGTVKLWQAADGRELRTILGPGNQQGGTRAPHGDCVYAVSWSSDGRRLATAGIDRLLKIWDADTGQKLLTLSGHEDWVLTVQWHPDGRRLASGSQDTTVRVWDGDAGKQLHSLTGHKNPVWSLAWSPDGRRLVSASENQTIKIWDTVSGKELRTLTGHGDSVPAVSWSPDGQRLASGSIDQTVKLWNASSGQELRTLKGHSDAVRTVSWSPDGWRLASGSADRTIKLWDVFGDQELRSFRGHRNGVRDVSWSPDGKRLASCSWDQTVRLWDASSGREIRALTGHSNWVMTVSWSPDGRHLASGGRDRSVKIWDATTGAVRRTLSGHGGLVYAVRWSPDGRRIASGSTDKTVRIWDADSGQELRILKGHSSSVQTVSWSPDSHRLASGSWDQTVKLWDAVSGQELHTLKGHSGQIYAVSWSPDGQWLASGGLDQSVKLWDIADGLELHSLKGHGNWVMAASWSPNSRRLASGSADGTVKLWDPVSGQELRTLRSDSRGIQALAWSPDGYRLAGGGMGYTVKLWDANPPTADVLAEREARGLLDALRALPLGKADILTTLRKHPGVPDEVRRLAESLLERYAEDTDDKHYHHSARALARLPYSTPALYRIALLQAQTACQLYPQQDAYRITLGMTLYRTGKFAEALETLTPKSFQNQGNPVPLAFLAMAQHRLGRQEQARAALARLREAENQPHWVNDEEARSFLDETENLIQGAK